MPLAPPVMATTLPSMMKNREKSNPWPYMAARNSAGVRFDVSSYVVCTIDVLCEVSQPRGLGLHPAIARFRMKQSLRMSPVTKMQRRACSRHDSHLQRAADSFDSTLAWPPSPLPEVTLRQTFEQLLLNTPAVQLVTHSAPTVDINKYPIRVKDLCSQAKTFLREGATFNLHYEPSWPFKAQLGLQQYVCQDRRGLRCHMVLLVSADWRRHQENFVPELFAGAEPDPPEPAVKKPVEGSATRSISLDTTISLQ